MKTLLIFHPSSELYGADRILVKVLANMDSSMKKIIILRKEGPLSDFLKEHVVNIEVHYCDFFPVIYRDIFNVKGILKFFKNYVSFFFYLQKMHKKFQFDYAYINTLSCSFLTIPLSILGIKRFVHVHEIIESPKVIAQVTAGLLKFFATKVVCVSKAVEDNLLKMFPSIAEKSQVIYNGIIPIPTNNRLPGSVIRFYLFGRIKYEKGHWFLLNALKDLPKNILVNCRFIMVGSPLLGKENILHEINTFLKKHGLSQVVFQKDFVPDISTEMNLADVCLVPSIMKDPFPTTVLEAMSAGKAVISTNNGGAVEALNKSCAILVGPNDVPALAKAIESLVLYPEKIVQLGNKGRNRYKKYYSNEVFVENWRQFLYGIA